MDGTVKLNDHDAVKLSWTQKIGPAEYGPTAVTTLWVDAMTYVPLRMVTQTIATLPTLTQTINTTALTNQMIPATTASLKALTPLVPARSIRAKRLPGY